ncbi:MAG: hypothetical protein EU550_02020 [Promethearchaeota archaeon]|nr:MAG: hypothetical protein EU550_02020 [Candidatus Lokiarchaeota archaeon]
MEIIDLIVPGFLAFREGLEAILVVVIILMYLRSTNQRSYNKYVYFGAILAISVSIIFAIIFNLLFGGFTGFLEQVFEGITFIISGLFIITLILWISIEGPKMKKKIETDIETSIKTGKIFSITTLTFTIILREGIELVLLLAGATSISGSTQLVVILGSIIGLGLSLAIGLLTYFGVKSINFSLFLKITNVILILFAAGLLTYGIHELIEAGLINPLIPELWNIKHIIPENFPDMNPLTPVWLEIIGSLMKALLGYNANPSLLEVIVYPLLLTGIGLLSLYLWRKSSAKN